LKTRRTVQLNKKKKIETSIIEKEEEIYTLICNRAWMKDVLIHCLIFQKD